MNKYKKIILKIIFLIGISLLLYPIVGSAINKYLQLKAIDKYVETVNIVENNRIQELYYEAISYNEKIYKRQKENKRYDLDQEYEKVLKIDSTSIIGYIEIPKVNIKLPIYHGTEDEALQQGVGHVKESSLPIGSKNQNSLLMGHSGLPTSKIFTNLEKLKVGDYIQIIILKDTLYYKISKIEIIKPEEVINKLAIIEGKDLVTLVTCTPYGVNSHRLVIQAERASKPTIIENKNQKNNILIILTICIILVLITLIILYMLKKNKKQLNGKVIKRKKVGKNAKKA